jgi:hypothetical protein
MLKRLEKLVAAGRLDASVLEEVRKATSPDVHHASGEMVLLAAPQDDGHLAAAGGDALHTWEWEGSRALCVEHAN